MIELPAIISAKGAALHVEYLENFSLAHTNKVILIKGNRGGFFVLANAILYLLSELEDQFVLTDLPFIKTKDSVVIKVNIDGCVLKDEMEKIGKISSVDNKIFHWKIGENNLILAASNIHSLGCIDAIKHTHVDKGVSKEGISIYCAVEDREEVIL